MSGQVGRLDAVDVLRGVATLGVVAIHAGSTADWALHPIVIGRSVPIFLVLMGVSAELWRQRAQPSQRGTWLAYTTSVAKRLALPYYAWFAVLVVIAGSVGRLPEQLTMWLAASFGYVPWAGPTWFIGALFLLTPFIPLFLVAADRWGAGVVALFGLVVTLLSQVNSMALGVALSEVLPLGPKQPVLPVFWYFVPAYFWHVTAGIWLARRGVRVGPLLFAVSLLVLVWAHYWIRQPGMWVLHVNALYALADVPLTVALLALCTRVHRAAWLKRPLVAVGRRSWGVYLGHILLFDLCEFLGRHYQFGPPPVRWAYYASLLATGLLLTALGRFLRNRLGQRFPVLRPR